MQAETARMRPSVAPGQAACGLALLLWLGLAFAGPAAHAQPAGPSKPAASGTANGKRAAPAALSEPRPRWSDLTPRQQQSLTPLAAHWASLSEGQKRKWLAISHNYPTMPPAEQAKLRSRMTEWVSLSPQQRSQARLNFAETKTLSTDEKNAKWEAYQALSPEERQKLAANANASGKPTGAATAVKPVSRQKLATVPTARPSPKAPPKIAVAPYQVDHNTLLPQPLQPMPMPAQTPPPSR